MPRLKRACEQAFSSRRRTDQRGLALPHHRLQELADDAHATGAADVVVHDEPDRFFPPANLRQHRRETRLPDGLFAPTGNPLGLGGYRSVAGTAGCRLAVVRDQVQHRPALGLGVPAERILVCETYRAAADAVLTGRADAYASVARAHASFIVQGHAGSLALVTVEAAEKESAFGCFGFGRSDDALRNSIDEALTAYLGSREHRAMMHGFGFTDAEIVCVAPLKS